MELYCTPESQYTTVKHSRQLFEHTYTSDPHGLGTLIPIELFQQDLLWKSSNTHFHSYSQLPNTRRDNPSSGYRSTCTPQWHLGLYITNPPFTSPDDRMSSPSTVALRITSNLYSFSNTTEPMSVKVPRLTIPYLWRCLSIVANVTLLLV
jgi:hypothetical protein